MGNRSVAVGGKIPMGRHAAEEIFTKGGPQAHMFAKQFKDEYVKTYFNMASKGGSGEEIAKATKEAMRTPLREDWEKNKNWHAPVPGGGNPQLPKDVVPKEFEKGVEDTVNQGRVDLENKVKLNQEGVDATINKGKDKVNKQGKILEAEVKYKEDWTGYGKWRKEDD